ncbi:Dyp-type peroxidase [Clavulina sp. PMI_390]|nr:Dyp-type peroxidase [Clavulina sp. PMI_390]
MRVSITLCSLAAITSVASVFASDMGGDSNLHNHHKHRELARAKDLAKKDPLNPTPSPARLRRSSYRTQPILKQWPGFPPLPTLDDIHHRNGTGGSQQGNYLPLDNIQGDIFVGMKKANELFYFFHINSPSDFRNTLRTTLLPLITSASTLVGPATSQPLAYLNMGFSQSGLNALGINDDLGDSYFKAGQYSDAPNLGDSMNDWESVWSSYGKTGIHGVMLIASDDQGHIDSLISTITSACGKSISNVVSVQGNVRPGAYAGHEHFGYLDGISNPGVNGFTTVAQPGQAVVPPGVILTGRSGDSVTNRPSWTRDGSFLVFRKLQQYVPEWNNYVVANAIKSNNLTTAQGAALFGARLIGRWQSGAPIDLAPLYDDADLGADPTRNNNFNFDHPEIPGFDLTSNESRCPFAAHIRKTRPRADLGIAKATGISAIVNGVTQTDMVEDAALSFMGIRAGIPYGPEVGSGESSSGTTNTDRGLCFAEYQSSIGNSFRTQQAVWANVASFPPGKTPANSGLDPVIGQGQRTVNGLNPYNTGKSYSVPSFVKARGGEYFFVPSISALTQVIATGTSGGNNGWDTGSGSSGSGNSLLGWLGGILKKFGF